MKYNIAVARAKVELDYVIRILGFLSAIAGKINWISKQ
jgi:hypothetical protein